MVAAFARPDGSTLQNPDIVRDERDDCPPALTTLIGREGELAILTGWLVEPRTRLITITGPGGVGKTTLAIEVARAICHATTAIVTVIPLAPVPGHDLLAATIGRALGGTTATPAELIVLINQRTTTARLLLVLDNFEHLLDGALVISELLTGCPELRIVVTSRERLRLRGEREYVLQPLALPPVTDDPAMAFDQAVASPAVLMFVDRMREVRTGFQLDPDNAGDITELCRRLDGLPLALELAAARTRSLPLPFLVARLERDLALLDQSTRAQADRHRTLTAVAAWSYDLLSAQEQRTFRQLAMLPGAFPLDAAIRTFGATEESAESANGDPDAIVRMLNQLASLVDKSLLNQAPSEYALDDGEPWFTMLGTLRQFGMERLVEAGEERDTRERFSHWVVETVVANTAPFPNAYVAPGQFAFCTAHLPSIRTALAWLESTGDLAPLVRLANRMGPFWTLRSFRSEGIDWCDRILAHPAIESIPETDLASIWLLIASLARTQMIFSHSRAAGEHALRLYTLAGDALGIAAAEDLLGAILRTAGDLEEALPHSQRAVAAFEALGETHWLALAHCNLGAVLLFRRDTAGAIPQLEAALRLYTALANEWGRTFCLLSLASAARIEGRVADAVRSLRGAIQTGRALQARESLLDGVNVAAALAVLAGLHEDGLRLSIAGDTQRRLIAYHLEAGDDAVARATQATATAALGPEPSESVSRSAREMTFSELIAETLQLLGAVERHRPAGPVPSPPRVVTDQPGLPTRPATPGRSASTLTGALDPLTAREREVLALLAEGITDREIGERLFISPRTAMRHVANILLKLQVSSRTAAASVFLRDVAG